MTESIKKKVQVNHPAGLHARPASLLVRIANRFTSEIMITKDGETVNGKSMMNLLTLAAEPGSWIDIEIIGIDAAQAMAAIEDFLVSGKEPKQ